MTAASVFHFLHIAVFAVIAAIELPAMYALRLDPAGRRRGRRTQSGSMRRSGTAPRRRPVTHSMQGNLKHSKGDISKLEKRGHLYFALTEPSTA